MQAAVAKAAMARADAAATAYHAALRIMQAANHAAAEATAAAKAAKAVALAPCAQCLGVFVGAPQWFRGVASFGLWVVWLCRAAGAAQDRGSFGYPSAGRGGRSGFVVGGGAPSRFGCRHPHCGVCGTSGLGYTHRRRHHVCFG